MLMSSSPLIMALSPSLPHSRRPQVDASGKAAIDVAATSDLFGLLASVLQRTSLLWNCANIGHMEDAKRLVEGKADIHEADNFGLTPLLHAARKVCLCLGCSVCDDATLLNRATATSWICSFCRKPTPTAKTSTGRRP